MNIDIIKHAQEIGLFGDLPIIERLKNRQCPLCGKDIRSEKFKDELSVTEFTISGMCQKCQDETFIEDED